MSEVYQYQSSEINELGAALSKAQGAWTSPKKDKTAAFPTKSGAKISYDYADLTSIIDHVKPFLKESGLAVSQMTVFKNDLFVLETMLIHSSGQWIKSHYPLPDPTKIKPQDFGSYLTYSRRYSFCAITNISADADDDANIAQGNTANISNRKPAQKAYNAPPKAHSTTSATLNFDIDAAKGSDFVFKYGKFKGKKMADIDVEQLKSWVNWAKKSNNTGLPGYDLAAQLVGN